MSNPTPKRAKTGGRQARPPAEHKQALTVRLPPDVVTLVRSQDNQATYLEAAIRHYHATT